MIKRIIKIFVVFIAVVFAGIQFIPVDRTNPAVDPSQTIEAHVAIPGDVGLILARSCRDCHTAKTVYPWYSRVAPVSWWLRDHIDHGRENLNLSVWGSYSPSQQAHRLDEICEEVRAGNMPLPSYLWMHRDAVLSEADKTALCTWADNARAQIESRNRPG